MIGARGIRTIVAILSLVVPLCGVDKTAVAEAWTVQGLYSVTVDGWVRSAVPDGFNYRCLRCTEQIEIEIKYIPEDAPWKSNSAFIATFDTEQRQRQFADMLMEGAVPAGFKVEVLQVGLSNIGGLQVLMFAAKVSQGSVVTVDTRFAAVHRNRLMMGSVHSYDGSLTPQNRAAIDAFLDGLKFEQ